MYDPNNIFARILRGEIPAAKVYEDDQVLSFMDAMPQAEGHTLVIPKKEVDYLFDLDDESYQNLFAFSKKVAKAIKAAVPCERIGVAVIGLEVPHAHIHLCPINGIHDLSFSNPRVKLTKEEFQAIAGSIRENFRG